MTPLKKKPQEMTFTDYAMTISIVKTLREAFVEQVKNADSMDMPCTNYVMDMFDNALIELITNLKDHGTDMLGILYDGIEGF